MKKEELSALGLTDEQIGKVFELYGQGIKKHQTAAETAAAKALDLTEQLSQREADVASLKQMDAHGLQAKLDELQARFAADKEAWEGKEKKRAYNDRRDKFFSGVEFTDEYSKRGVYAEFDERGFRYNDTDQGFQGASEWLDKLKETSPTSFKASTPPPRVVRPAGNPLTREITRSDFGNMKYRERVALKKESPEQYQKLTEE